MFQKDLVLNNRYKILDIIGKGGIGTTYLASDLTTQNEVVIKALGLSSMNDWKVYDLFVREVSALKKIDHPNIPDYLDYFEDSVNGESCFLLVQEYANGKNLFEIAKSGKVFSPAEVKEILVSLLDILKYIHNLNPPLIHRDINPKNIIIDSSGKVYLVDFGAVGYIIKNTLAAAQSNTFVGTIGYMPPEQLYGKVLPASDIYSLGITIVFLLTGKEPFDFSLDGLKLNFLEYLDCPDELKLLLDRMTDPDVKERIQTAGRVLEALKNPALLKTDVDELKGIIKEMHSAIIKNDIQKLKYLIDQGMPLNPRSSKVKSPLKKALDYDHMQIAQLLLENGADVNAKFKGMPLLHEAVINKKTEQVKLLLKFGANVNLKDDKQGQTPVQYADQKGFETIKNILIKYGAHYVGKKEKKVIQTALSPPPRKVPLRLRFLLWHSEAKSGISAGYMLLFMGLLFSYVFVISARLIPSIRLLGADKTTRGLVLDVEETNSSVNDVTVFKNTFRFSLDEKEYTQYSFTTGKIYSRGDRVTIEYLSDDPEFSIIKGTSYSVFGFFPIFVIILPVVGYSIIFNSRPYHIRKYIKLLKKGKLTKARVAYIKRRGNKCHYYYQYHDEKGIEKTGKYVTDDIKFSKPGEMLPIIYCSTWYECSRYLEKPISHISYQSDSWNLNLGNEKFWTALGFWALDKLSFIILAAFVYYIFQSML